MKDEMTKAEKQMAMVKRLVEDDEFREKLQNNPKEALAEAGVEIDEDKIPEKVELPSKEQIEKHVAEALKKQTDDMNDQMMGLFFGA